jgi:hypothetical protein
MNQFEVNGGLFIREARFSEIDLGNAKVGGQLDMSGAKCTSGLNMNQFEVNGSLFMRGAEFSEIDLGNAKVGGQLDMSGAKCTSGLNMNQFEVNGNMFVHGAEFSEIDLGNANIGGGLSIQSGRFASLDLTGSNIKTVLNLGFDDRSKPQWSGGSPRLLLRNAVVGTVQAPPQLDAFPNDLDLNGFKYTDLGGEMASREPKWFSAWLEKDTSYSPQTYYQLAAVLRAMGQPGKADEILYAGKEHERSKARSHREISRWIELSLANYTSGYGYRYYYTMRWIIGLILFIFLGAQVYNTTASGNALSWGEKLAFSFDILLPIVKLDESHYKVLLSGWQHYYFYFHKLVGYVLGLIVVAGLSGIMKK